MLLSTPPPTQIAVYLKSNVRSCKHHRCCSSSQRKTIGDGSRRDLVYGMYNAVAGKQLCDGHRRFADGSSGYFSSESRPPRPLSGEFHPPLEVGLRSIAQFVLCFVDAVSGRALIKLP
jgi:hypothetical protein